MIEVADVAEVVEPEVEEGAPIAEEGTRRKRRLHDDSSVTSIYHCI